MIPIIFSGNGNGKIFEGLLMSVMSLAKNTSEALEILVLTMDLSDENPNFKPFSSEQISLLDNVVKLKNKESFAKKLDVTTLYKQHLHSFCHVAPAFGFGAGLPRQVDIFGHRHNVCQ